VRTPYIAPVFSETSVKQDSFMITMMAENQISGNAVAMTPR